jgi:hypothetical protein
MKSKNIVRYTIAILMVSLTTHIPAPAFASDATVSDVKFSWLDQVYAPQSAEEKEFFSVSYKNNSTNDFYYVGFSTLRPSGKPFLIFGTAKGIKAGAKGEIKVPLNYIYFLNVRGPIDYGLNLCVRVGLTDPEICSESKLTFITDKPKITATPKSEEIPKEIAKPKPIKTQVGTPGTDKSGSEQISVTCRKGKEIKKVSSISPICPSGYASDTGIGTKVKSSFATFLLQKKSTLRSIDGTVPLGDGFVYSMKVCNGNKSEASKFTSARWIAIGVNGGRFRPSGISGYSAVEPVYPFDDSAFTVLSGECFSGNLIFITKQVIKEIRYELPKEVTGKLEILRIKLG